MKPFSYFSTQDFLKHDLETDQDNLRFRSKGRGTQAHKPSDTRPSCCRRGLRVTGVGGHLVGEAGPHGGGDAVAQVGIIEDDGGVFAAQLQREPLAVRGAALRDALGRQRAAREGEQRHIGVAHQRLSCLATCSEHHVHHPGRHP